MTTLAIVHPPEIRFRSNARNSSTLGATRFGTGNQNTLVLVASAA